MRRSIRQSLLLSVPCFALFSVPHTAFAQEGAAEAEGDQIVVRGIRGSLDSAANTKRRSDQIIDVIVAEDIGALPDQNVADTLQRVSGVQIRRSGAGEGDTVDIRGFSQNRFEINGRTLREFDGRSSNAVRDNGQQSLLGIIPSELISRIEVFKLLSADMIEGSQGGTVNIVTRKPLDKAGFQAAASAEISYSDLSEKVGYGGSVLVSDTFADDTFGMLLNVSYDTRELFEDRFFSFAGFQPIPSGDGSDPAQVEFADPNGDGIPSFRIRDLRYQRTQSERKRLGVNGSLQWEPSPSFSSYLDVFYVRQETDEFRQWFSVSLPNAASDYSEAVFTENDTLIAGTFSAPLQGNINMNPTNEAEAISTALGGTWESGPLTVFAELVYSDSIADGQQQFVRVQSNQSVEASFDFRDGDLPSLSLPNTLNGDDILDLSNYNIPILFDRVRTLKTNEWAARLDLEYELLAGPLKSIEVGGRYSDLEVDPLTQSLNPRFRPGTPADDPAIADFVGVVDFTDVFSDRNPGFPTMFVGTLNNPQPTDGLCTAFGGCQAVSDDIGASFILNETTYAGYAKANFEGDLGSVPFSGNFGVRVVRTEQNSSGLSLVGGQPTPTIADRSYTDWLPSGVVTFELADGLLLRFGGAKVMARPNTGSLTPAVTVNTEGTIATGGNPLLDPFRATQFDASLEFYPGGGAAYTVALFYKDVESFVTTSSRIGTAPGLEELGQITINTQINGEGGEVKGVEFAMQQPFTFLPEPLDGFGVLVNYSYIDSSSPVQDVRSPSNEGLPLLGLSKHNVNAIAYYEKFGLNARLAYNYRTDFLSQVRFLGVFQDASSSLDASISYDITDRVTVDFDAVNLLRTEQVLYGTFEESLQSLSVNDRRFVLGLRARF